MRRTVFLLVAIPVLGLGFAAMASAVGDQYGPDYPEDTTSTSTGSTTGGPAQSAAGRFSYTATLDAQQEVPAPSGASSARGLFTAIAATQGAKTTLRWTLTFSGLTGRADAAHIHLGGRGVAGDVLRALCGPCRSGHTGTRVLSTDAAEALATGGAYVNVHTAKNAAGEIRGQATRGAIAYRVAITSAQEVPQPSGAARATGIFSGSLRATGAKATLTWR
ncbi:MAG: CHRD domain-containing protein, partial [Gaiella sp.]